MIKYPAPMLGTHSPNNRFSYSGSGCRWFARADEARAVRRGALHPRRGQPKASQGARFYRRGRGRCGRGGDVLPGLRSTSPGEPTTVATSREGQHSARPQRAPLVPRPGQRLSGVGGEKGNSTKWKIHCKVNTIFPGKAKDSREATLPKTTRHPKATCFPKTAT